MKQFRSTQITFFKNRRPSKYSYGGELRKRRSGRNARPLSTKEAHHIVFKIKKENLRNKSFRHPKNFRLVQLLLNKYAKKFFVKIEQISFQHDHIHICARSSRRSHFHHFFRVFAGQIAQTMKVTDTPAVGPNKNFSASANCTVSNGKKVSLWKWRPFTRIVKGYKNYCTLRNYIQLNEKEVTGVILYRKQRLKGLSPNEWKILWT